MFSMWGTFKYEKKNYWAQCKYNVKENKRHKVHQKMLVQKNTQRTSETNNLPWVHMGQKWFWHLQTLQELVLQHQSVKMKVIIAGKVDKFQKEDHQLIEMWEYNGH